jgi:hypothetical protein
MRSTLSSRRQPHLGTCERGAYVRISSGARRRSPDALVRFTQIQDSARTSSSSVMKRSMASRKVVCHTKNVRAPSDRQIRLSVHGAASSSIGRLRETKRRSRLFLFCQFAISNSRLHASHRPRGWACAYTPGAQAPPAASRIEMGASARRRPPDTGHVGTAMDFQHGVRWGRLGKAVLLVEPLVLLIPVRAFDAPG